MSTSQGHPVLDKTVTISDATASKYRILQGDTSDTTNSLLVMAAATGPLTKPLAILLTATTAANEKASARFIGICKVEMNGDTVDVGSSIIAAAGGQGAVAGAPAQTQQWAIGFALEPSTEDGDEIDVQIAPHLIVKGTAA